MIAKDLFVSSSQPHYRRSGLQQNGHGVLCSSLYCMLDVKCGRSLLHFVNQKFCCNWHRVTRSRSKLVHSAAVTAAAVTAHCGQQRALQPCCSSSEQSLQPKQQQALPSSAMAPSALCMLPDGSAWVVCEDVHIQKTMNCTGFASWPTSRQKRKKKNRAVILCPIWCSAQARCICSAFTRCSCQRCAMAPVCNGSCMQPRLQ